MADAKRPAVDLFNSPTLSDVTLKQISEEGQVREYYANKAILSAESPVFLAAFSGRFAEANESHMIIRDDNPNDFELLLKYIYTRQYDEAAVEKAAGNRAEEVKVLLGIHLVADKYGVSVIYEEIAKRVQALLAKKDVCTPQVLQAAVEAYYENHVAVDTPLGRVFVSLVLERYPLLTGLEPDTFKYLLKTQPTFATDVALALHEKYGKVLTTSRAETYECGHCKHIGVFAFTKGHKLVGRDKVYCEACGTVNLLSSATRSSRT
ncbi:hypothetical protein E8E13_011114 [Curvularia kusanoi]|uniref:BTB domain-containing protein n=1 Tax=Curvularia kusanoi TaxID=90978 RepID=A0A9P4TP23_CURKU|nr:hypothetical protein E8E13_011114 [Curvularia kusanoi]